MSGRSGRWTVVPLKQLVIFHIPDTEFLSMPNVTCRLSILCMFLLVSSWLGCSPPPKSKASADAIKTYRDIPGITDEEVAAIEALKASRDKLSFGSLISTEMFELPDGSQDGFVVRFCNLLTELFGIPFEIESYEWDELIENLNSQQVAFTGELTPTPERMEKYSMTIPITGRLLRMFVLADSDKIQTEADVEGRTIAFLEDTTLAEAIRKLYRISFHDVEVADYHAAVKMLQSGEIDGFIDEAVADPAFDEWDFIRSFIFFPMVHSPVSLATADPELAPIVSVFDKYIIGEGGKKLADLYKEGDFAYAKNKLQKILSHEEKDYLKDLRHRRAGIPVAYEVDNYPINFYNEMEKEYQGIAVDVMTAISRLLDVPFEIVGTKHTTWEEVYEAVKSGTVPMIAELLQTEERKEFFIWGSTPYARTSYALLSRVDLPSLEIYQVARYNVGAVRQSTNIKVFRDLFPHNKEPILYDSMEECLAALGRGEIDLWMASEYALISQTHFRERSGYKINLRLPVPTYSSFGFNINEKVLCSIINKAQQFVATDVIETQWVGRSFDYSKKIAEQRAFFMTIFSAMVSLMLVATIFLFVRAVKLRKVLTTIANKDSLTDIFNRRHFMEIAIIQAERSYRMKSQCFLAIYDLDHFKSVNDEYGHLAGDKVLKETVQRVKDVMRPYDIFGRYGGEEFIILLCDITEEDAISTVERLRKEICKSPVEFGKLQITVSASFGIAALLTGSDIDVATKYADKALYEAKAGGRNRVAFYSAERTIIGTSGVS